MVYVFCKVTEHGMVTVIVGCGRAMHAPTLENGKFKTKMNAVVGATIGRPFM